MEMITSTSTREENMRRYAASPAARNAKRLSESVIAVSYFDDFIVRGY
jgi:hypothetical protein